MPDWGVRNRLRRRRSMRAQVGWKPARVSSSSSIKTCTGDDPGQGNRHSPSTLSTTRILKERKLVLVWDSAFSVLRRTSLQLEKLYERPTTNSFPRCCSCDYSPRSLLRLPNPHPTPIQRANISTETSHGLASGQAAPASRRKVSRGAKAALAYMILVILAMSSEVRSGFSFPVVLTGATVVVVAGYPGANIGQCIGGEDALALTLSFPGIAFTNF
jgi:hypothetical protein